MVTTTAGHHLHGRWQHNVVTESVAVDAWTRDGRVRPLLPRIIISIVVVVVVNYILACDGRHRGRGILDGHALHVAYLNLLLFRPLGRVASQLVQLALL